MKMKQTVKNLAGKITTGLKYHIVDTTALNTLANPIFQALEVTVYRMSDQVSLNARVFASTVGYLGVGFVLARGRDLSRYVFGITNKTKEKVQRLHDKTYLTVFNAGFAPTMYVCSGEADPIKIGTGTAIAMALGWFTGDYFGYAVDSFRDLAGLEKCERKFYQDLIKRQKPSVKKGLAALLVGTSVVINYGVYKLTPDKSIAPENTLVVQQFYDKLAEESQ